MENLKGKMRVPYGQTVHGEEEIKAVENVLRTSTQMGKSVHEMERRVSELYNKKYGIMLNSGTSANYLAVEILELPEGAEVITPVLTFSTTVAPIVKNKLIPVFLDVKPGTYNIDANGIEQMITKKTKAVMIPNLLGNLPDWSAVRAIADKHNLIVIEDSADTLGATINGKSAGFFSDISTTSFYGSHVINCAGNGGMLCVNSEKHFRIAKLLRSWGRSSSLFADSESIESRFNIMLDDIQYDAKFIFEKLGYNLEPSEMGAAFGLVQLDKLEKNIALREENFAKHYRFFEQYNDWFIMPKQLQGSRTGWLAFPLTVKNDAPFTRTDMQIYLEKHDIQTRTIFTGNILRQPGFKNIPHIATENGYLNADAVMRGGILIGCHHGLSNEQINYIHEVFTNFASKYTKRKAV